MLEEEEGSLACFDGEVLLHFLAFLATEGRIGEDEVVAVLVLHVLVVIGEGVGMDEVGGLDPVEDEVHDADDIGEGFLFLAVEGAGLEGGELVSSEVGGAEVVVGFAEEAGGSAGGVAHAFPDAGVGDFDHGPDEGAWGVVFAPVAPGIAHAFDLFFVEGGKFVLLLLGTKLERVDQFDSIMQGVATLELVADFAEDFPNLVLDGIGAFGPAFEGM